jgi:hypothetical protein
LQLIYWQNFQAPVPQEMVGKTFWDILEVHSPRSGFPRPQDIETTA